MANLCSSIIIINDFPLRDSFSADHLSFFRHVRCMLGVYTIVLYRVEAGKVDPWEVFLYIWVIVSDALYRFSE